MDPVVKEIRCDHERWRADYYADWVPGKGVAAPRAEKQAVRRDLVQAHEDLQAARAAKEKAERVCAGLPPDDDTEDRENELGAWREAERRFVEVDRRVALLHAEMDLRL